MSIIFQYRGLWFIHWPESVKGYAEGPYTSRDACEYRIREEESRAAHH